MHSLYIYVYEYDGDFNFHATPNIRENGLELKVQLDGFTSATKDIVVCGKAMEIKVFGDGKIGGRWHIIVKDSK